MIAYIKSRLAAAKTATILYSMSDRELADIGINRGDIKRIVREHHTAQQTHSDLLTQVHGQLMFYAQEEFDANGGDVSLGQRYVEHVEALYIELRDLEPMK